MCYMSVAARVIWFMCMSVFVCMLAACLMATILSLSLSLHRTSRTVNLFILIPFNIHSTMYLTHTHTHTHSHTHTHTHTYTHTHKNTHTHTRTHKDTHTYTHTHPEASRV